MLVLLLAAVTALTLVPAAAQDEEAGPFDDVSQLEGIEEAVARTYSIDFEALMSVTPEDPEADPFADLEGPVFIFVEAIQFEDDSAAEDAFDLFRDEAVDSMAESEEGVEAEFTEEEIDDLGDQAMAIDMETVEEGEESFLRISIAQQDEYLLMAMTLGTTDDSTENNDALLEYLVDEGEAGGDVEFDESGSSTGGLFDFFPDDDHESLGGLVVSTDQILFPVPDEDA
jgi:hypothetical protein